MTAWAGFGIGVAVVAVICACVLVAAGLVLAARGVWLLCWKARQRPQSASEEFWAAVGDHDTFRSDLIKERIARMPYIAPFETGAPWRSAAEAEWDASR